jgi:hypothetical protein
LAEIGQAVASTTMVDIVPHQSVQKDLAKAQPINPCETAQATPAGSSSEQNVGSRAISGSVGGSLVQMPVGSASPREIKLVGSSPAQNLVGSRTTSGLVGGSLQMPVGSASPSMTTREIKLVGSPGPGTVQIPMGSANGVRGGSMKMPVGSTNPASARPGSMQMPVGSRTRPGLRQ